MSVVTIADLKAKYQTGDFPTEQDFIDLIDTLGAGTSYKKYVALLTQTGTAAPTAVVLENTLGGTVAWTRVAPGNYYGTLTGALTSGKTVVFNGSRPFNKFVFAERDTINRVIVDTSELDSDLVTFVDTDGILLSTSIEIRVYP